MKLTKENTIVDESGAVIFKRPPELTKMLDVIKEITKLKKRVQEIEKLLEEVTDVK